MTNQTNNELKDFLGKILEENGITIEAPYNPPKKITPQSLLPFNRRLASYSTREILSTLIKETSAKFGGEDEDALQYYQVINDLKKISFGKRNVDFGFGNLSMPGFEPGYDEIAENFVVMWGGANGNEDEIPVAFCLYKDNHGKLRGYIPTKGNVFNPLSKASYDKVEKVGGYSYDMAALREDVNSRIKVDPKTIPEESYITESGGIGCIDASKLPPGKSITDVLRDVRNKQKKQMKKEKKILDAIKNLADENAPSSPSNQPFNYDLLTVDWSALPEMELIDDETIDVLKYTQEEWKNSSRPFDSDWNIDDDWKFFTKAQVKKWSSFTEIQKCSYFGDQWWVNPAYETVKPSTVKFGFKYVLDEDNCYDFHILFDESNGQLIGFYYHHD